MTAHSVDPDDVVVEIGGEIVSFSKPMQNDVNVYVKVHSGDRKITATITLWGVRTYQTQGDREEIDVTPGRRLLTDGGGS